MNSTSTSPGIIPAKQRFSRRVTNLVKIIEKAEKVHYSNARSFNPDAVKSQIRNFCKTAISRINTDCVVTANIDEVGVHLSVITDEFTFTFIYQQGGKL
jgi:hypothetical protein